MQSHEMIKRHLIPVKGAETVYMILRDWVTVAIPIPYVIVGRKNSKRFCFCGLIATGVSSIPCTWPPTFSV